MLSHGSRALWLIVAALVLAIFGFSGIISVAVLVFKILFWLAVIGVLWYGWKHFFSGATSVG